MKKPNIMAVILSLTGIMCIISLLFFSGKTMNQIRATEKNIDAVAEKIAARQTQIKDAEEKYTQAVDKVQNNIHRMKQKQQTFSQTQPREKAEIEGNASSGSSVFSQSGESSEAFSSE